MLISSSAIVLSKVRYQDNDLIIKCLTRDLGVVSYMIKNISVSKKSKNKFAFFQLLNILDLETNFNQNRSIQYIKDLKVKYNFISLHTNIYKSSVVMFLSEILSNIIQSETKDVELFDFIEKSLVWYDKSEESSTFYLIFLMEITHYLGFYPDCTNMHYEYFNLEEGIFENSKNSKYVIKGNSLVLFKRILGIKFDSNKLPFIDKLNKKDILKNILIYYKLHVDGFKDPKSLKVLNQIFAD
ncbi:DNA repair protein RecO [Flavobacteriaceae bacterium]|nr:DNA repair protein RecO [Flavobacteriaceae bacterium]MDB9712569.1 DNA repair protein RecO [Flavobacteriaceae bacterium]MDC1492121.1 DNA repair protein RecO [Flavobacteriaceae bacterium]